MFVMPDQLYATVCSHCITVAVVQLAPSFAAPACDWTSCQLQPHCCRYAVIPLSPNSGLIGWVPNTDTLHALIREYRDARKIPLNVEHRLMMGMAPDHDHLTVIQKVEVFEHALDSTSGEDLHKVSGFVAKARVHNQLCPWCEAVVTPLCSLAARLECDTSAHPLHTAMCADIDKERIAGALAEEPQQRGVVGAPHQLHPQHGRHVYGALSSTVKT